MSECEKPPGTHDVFNQPEALENYNLYDQDTALMEALYREGEGRNEAEVRGYGRLAGHELLSLGFDANENPPDLHTHDRFGRRIDRVKYHPAYHTLMGAAIENGLHSYPWIRPGRGAHVARAAMLYCHNQMEAGTSCPVTMTFACLPVIRRQPEVAEAWEARVTATLYDGRDVPASEKKGATIGMAMTEKQGGSDVRANTTRAHPRDASGPGRPYELTGHKWFCSAPMSDAFLTLAQTDRGLSCFLLPRWRPDGMKNAIYLQRLKNKLGNRSNASAEVEFRCAHAVLIGEEGRGVPTIIEMVALTRFDCMVGSAALMRQALSQAIHHARFRKTFGRFLMDHPLMQNVLADLAIESEAALVMVMRVARALDGSMDLKEERLLVRVATAVGKYWICKRAPAMVIEAAECLGGNGYIEESILPRLYREAPVNAIWEGCGNIQALDVLRAMQKSPDALEVFLEEIRPARQMEPHLDERARRLEKMLADKDSLEFRSRRLIEEMALTFQGALLVRHSPRHVAEGFCRTRLAEHPGRLYGTLPPGIDAAAIIDRAFPPMPGT